MMILLQTCSEYLMWNFSAHTDEYIKIYINNNYVFFPKKDNYSYIL